MTELGANHPFVAGGLNLWQASCLDVRETSSQPAVRALRVGPEVGAKARRGGDLVRLCLNSGGQRRLCWRAYEGRRQSRSIKKAIGLKILIPSQLHTRFAERFC